MNPEQIVSRIEEILQTKGGLPSARVCLVEHLGALAHDLNKALGVKVLPSSQFAVIIESTDSESNLSVIMLMVGAVLVNSCTVGQEKIFLYEYAS